MKNLFILLFVFCTAGVHGQSFKWPEKNIEKGLSGSIAESKERGLFKQACNVEQSLVGFSYRYRIKKGKLEKRLKFSKEGAHYFTIKECWKEEVTNEDGKRERYILFTLAEGQSILKARNYNQSWTYKPYSGRFSMEEHASTGGSTVYKYASTKKKGIKSMYAIVEVQNDFNRWSGYWLRFRPQRSSI